MLPQTQTKIKFGTKYQILGFSVSKSYFGSLHNLLSTILTVLKPRLSSLNLSPLFCYSQIVQIEATH